MSDNQKSEQEFSKPEISHKKSFSPIWILPIIALMIGVSLIVQSYLNAGIMIALQVDTAEGIEVGKTKVMYKGIETGVVKKYVVSDDLNKVILMIEMDKKTEPYLNEFTQFWVVAPNISLSGVSGLDTIIGGRYIAIDAKEGTQSRRDFVALENPPPPSAETPGLHIKLRLKSLASIDRGTQVYYKQIPIGEVTNYTLEENDTEIHAWVIIKPRYAHLIKKDSLFYNISGLKINASLSGIDIKTDSLISALVGGIAVHNSRLPGAGKEPAKHGMHYLLYEDFESARIGIPLVLRFKNAVSIAENQTQIKYQGKKIGRIGELRYDKENNETIAVAHLAPHLEDVLTEDTQFWIVKPSVSLLRLSGLDALIQGNYIEMRPGTFGKKKRDFLVANSVPPLSDKTPGLHFYIDTDTLGSIDKDIPLFYKDISIGHIQGYELTENAEQVRLNAYVKPKFMHLIKKSTRFYNVSGLTIKGGLSGVEIRTGSLMSILAGGIAIYTPAFEANLKAAENGDIFKLYEDFDDAKAGIDLQLTFENAQGIEADKTRIMYKGQVLGVIKKLTLDKQTGHTQVRAVLDPAYANLLVEDTRFWMVRPKVGLAGIQNLETLFSGHYITLRPGVSKKPGKRYRVSQHRPPYNYQQPGLHLKLSSEELGSVKIGSPVMFQRIKIGDVQDYELAGDRKNINILIHILPQYTDLISADSRFYNASGFELEAGLSGVQLRSGSFASILNGGVSLYRTNRTSPLNTKAVRNGQVFKLFKDYDAARKNAFYVKVKFDSPRGLSVGSSVFYRGIEVGEVTSIDLNEQDIDSVLVTLELDALLKNRLGKASRFWVTEARLGLARTENVQNLITGNSIEVDPVKGPEADYFTGLEQRPLLASAKNGYTVSLTASRLSSLTIGDPVYYRQIKVGKVIGYELAETSDQILIHLAIRNRFRPLIRENTKFWHASGINMDISLFGTSNLRTESLESILSGGVAFATPDNEQMGRLIPSGSYFVLHDEPKPEWESWNPIIHLGKETQQN